MRRILTAVLASGLLALALPAAASAHHAGRRDAAHRARAHRHHRHHHRTVVFAPSAKPSDTTPGTEPPAPSSEPVATVDSFEGGVLKITLPDGSTVSGKVTEETWISCGCDGHDTQDGPQGSQDGGSHGWQGGEGGPGFDHHDDAQMPQNEQGSCGVSSLVPGAKVKEAELNVSAGGAVWEKVELLPQS